MTSLGRYHAWDDTAGHPTRPTMTRASAADQGETAHHIHIHMTDPREANGTEPAAVKWATAQVSGGGCVTRSAPTDPMRTCRQDRPRLNRRAGGCWRVCCKMASRATGRLLTLGLFHFSVGQAEYEAMVEVEAT